LSVEVAELERDAEAHSLRTALASREAMLASLQEGIVLFGGDGAVRFMNFAAEDLLGRRIRYAGELAPDALHDAVCRVLAEEERAEVVFEASGRTVEAVVSTARPLPSALLVARDVTAALRTEQLRRNFVDNASHELKTPVSSIVGLVSALEMAAGDERATRRFVNMLSREAERLSRLVSDLLDLSRLESDAGPRDAVRFDQVVVDQAEKLFGDAVNAGLRLIVEPVSPTRVMGREPDLAQMVHNLLANAIRYSHHGGDVLLALEPLGGTAVLTVSDTGVGIPAADLDRVFERFYRVDAARDRETGGTGLGLAIVRHVAESHGGDVAVRSRLGAGSTFTVRIPLLEQRARTVP
jgi:two-component system, OmpR family, sensor histidine kinase SenX3